ELAIDLGQVFGGAVLDFAGRFLVESFDRGDFVGVDIGELFDRREAFRSQELGNHPVNVKSLHEQGRAFGEFLLATLARLLLGQDVDVPTDELGREAYVLATATDGERKLLVGHHDFDALGLFVENDLGDIGRLQRRNNEVGNG